MSKYTEALRRIMERRRQRTLDRLPEPKREYPKRFVVLSIVVGILSLYLAYAFGFYQGMRLAGESSEGNTVSEEPALAPRDTGEVVLETPPNSEARDIPSQVEELQDREEPVEEAETESPFYTVQLVTYTHRNRAEEEVKMLEGQGYHAFIIPGKKFHSVCVEKLDQNTEAMKKLSEVRKFFGNKIYQDAFVRYVKK